MVGHASSPTCVVYVYVTMTRSNVKVKVTALLNFEKFPKTALSLCLPCLRLEACDCDCR